MRSLKAIRKLFVAGLLLSTLLTTVAHAAPEPKVYESFLTRIVAQVMGSQHYTRQNLNDEIAEQIFTEYLNTLDPNHRFFLKSDIEEFGQKRQMIDDYLSEGDLSFAFDVYARLLERVQQRVEYSRARLKEPFDFDLNEEIIVDRSDAPWAETKEELDEIWRKQLKNRVIIYKLMQQKGKDSKKSDSSETNNESDGDTTVVETDPVTRTLKMQERYLHYLEENESIEIVELFLASVAHIYDPHSTYMAPTTEEDFDINMSLSLDGIGAVLTTEQGYVKIVSIVPGGPADKDGELQEGDRIVAVRQEGEEPVDVIDMPLRKVVQMIRGPKGTKVILTVIEADKGLSGVPVKIDIIRDEVQLKAQEAKAKIYSPNFDITPAQSQSKQKTCIGQPKKVKDGKFMVLTLPSFYSDFKSRRNGKDDYKSASRDVKKLLQKAQEKQLDGVILDLRGNGGGSLEEAIKIAGFFFHNGPVVQVRNSFGKTKVYEDPDETVVYEGPVVVLVDRLSASASEIVAAAIKDHHRGVIIGENHTHGKGTVQTILELNRFMRTVPRFEDKEVGSLKFTIAKFYRANGDSTQRRGVPPDIKFPSFTDHMELGEASLDHALAWDQIDPLEVNSSFDVRPFIPTLKECSEARLKNNPEYTKLLDAVQRFAKIKNRKSLPLNLEKRRQLHESEEEWLNEVRSKTVRRSNYDSEDGKTDAEAGDSSDEGAGDSEGRAKDARDDSSDTKDGEAGTAITEINDDLMLEEALRVISDLVWLQRGELIADPDPAKADNGKN